MPEDMEDGRSLIVCFAPGIAEGGLALEAGAGMGGAVRGAREIFTVCAFSTSPSAPAEGALASDSLMVCEAPPAADWGVSLMVAAEADVWGASLMVAAEAAA